MKMNNKLLMAWGFIFGSLLMGFSYGIVSDFWRVICWIIGVAHIAFGIIFYRIGLQKTSETKQQNE